MLHCLIKTVSISRKPNLSGGGGHDEPDEIFTDFLCSAPEIYQVLSTWLILPSNEYAISFVQEYEISWMKREWLFYG